MKINYKFNLETEPTDEQLHLLMQEVAIEAKKKAMISDEHFMEQLQKMVQDAQKQESTRHSD